MVNPRGYIHLSSTSSLTNSDDRTMDDQLSSFNQHNSRNIASASGHKRNHFYIEHKTNAKKLDFIQFTTSSNITEEEIIERLNHRPIPRPVRGKRTHVSKDPKTKNLIVQQDEYDLVQTRGIFVLTFLGQNEHSDKEIFARWAEADGLFHRRTNSSKTTAREACHLQFGDDFKITKLEMISRRHKDRWQRKMPFQTQVITFPARLANFWAMR
ncbi:hypothetical protein B7494_g5577 [Chlorociboria aeruginascens]|nr:hypothetical protein B7494_g5577 [Chlorociboria aeruginascens]